MVMHPTREGVAIANLSTCFKPANGYNDDWTGVNPPVTIEERNSNARLVAAAPELLEACKAFVKEYDEVLSPDYDTSYLKEVADRCKAAIHKAEGRS